MNDNPARGSNDAPRGFYLLTVTFFPLPGRYYKLSVLLMCFVVPTFVPCYVWGESLWVAYFVPAVLRYTLVLNATWLVNSAAHMWGNRPYDNTINPRENKYVAFGAIGEFLSTSLSPVSPCSRSLHHCMLEKSRAWASVPQTPTLRCQ